MDDGNWAAGEHSGLCFDKHDHVATGLAGGQLDCLDFPLPVHTTATANSKAVVDRRETTPLPQAGTDNSVRCDGRYTTPCLVDMSTLNTPWLAIFAHCVLTVCFSLSFLRWGDERVRDGGREDVRDGGRED